MGYNPLFDSLLGSSLLVEGPDVVAVWALLLASADRAGISEWTAPAMAGLMRISEERVDRALEILSSPDPRSKSKREEGRRIIKDVGGGWFVVNHDIYRDKARREASAERMARSRERRSKM